MCSNKRTLPSAQAGSKNTLTMTTGDLGSLREVTISANGVNLKDLVLAKIDFREFYETQLAGKKISWSQSGEGQVLCCFHDETEASLYVNSITGEFYCFGCKAGGDVFKFYMLKHNCDFKTALAELAKVAEVDVKNNTQQSKQIESVYQYVDENNNLLFEVIRYVDKSFVQRRKEGDGFIYNLNGLRRVLYRLPEVIKADFVLIAEGEKDVENLRALGFIATTNPGGAGKWLQEYNKYFLNKDVVIFGDNDQVGIKHANTVADNLLEVAKSVKVIVFSELPPKSDVSDYIYNLHQEGLSFEEIRAEIIKRVDEAEEYKSLSAKLLTVSDILSTSDHVEYLLQGLIPEGAITLLFGRGGLGKTTLALQIACAIANGESIFNLSTKKTAVYYVDFENPLSVLKQRLEGINIQTSDLRFWHLACEVHPPYLDKADWEQYLNLKPAGLLIFDTLRASCSIDENNSKDVAVIMQRLKTLREKGFTILLLHHTPKADDSIYKGSTAILDLCDHVLGLEEAQKSEMEFKADNALRLGTRIKTRFEPSHVFVQFDIDRKIFKLARDPDLQICDTMLELLKEHRELNHNRFFEVAKAEIGVSKPTFGKLIEKGLKAGYWEKRQEGRKVIYQPKIGFMVSSIYIGKPKNQFSDDSTSEGLKSTPNLHSKTVSEGSKTDLPNQGNIKHYDIEL